MQTLKLKYSCDDLLWSDILTIYQTIINHVCILHIIEYLILKIILQKQNYDYYQKH